jgi:AcrR family transcriptional regulator
LYAPVKRISLVINKSELTSMPRGRPREFDVERALGAALLLFWRHGYEGTSLAALTKTMGIKMPSLYAAFGNKESLFRRALQRYLREPASYLPIALREPTAERVINSLFRGAINMTSNERHPDGCMLVQGALVAGPESEHVRAELARTRRSAERLLRQRLRAAVKTGELPARADPTALAGFVMTVVWGMSVQAAGGASRRQLLQVSQLAKRALESSYT